VARADDSGSSAATGSPHACGAYGLAAAARIEDGHDEAYGVDVPSPVVDDDHAPQHDASAHRPPLVGA
jgi:hypothetical protein